MRETIEAIYENGVLRPLGRLSILEGQRIRIIVEKAEDKTVDLEETVEAKRYDFSDLVGRLSWAGDPVVEQRRLRDEWK
ncbi:MAG: antitoxin family protein [Proteobacteria bacterium]|nr:antitoxin family protein [Pseudomonadota bacterium]